MRNVNKVENSIFRNGQEHKKVIWNPHADLDHHRILITSRWSSLAVPDKFGRRPFLRLSVTMFTERQNDYTTSALLAEVTRQRAQTSVSDY